MSLDALLSVASAVVPVASVISSALNHAIREKTAAEVELPKWLLVLAAVLNVFSVNFDKSVQMVKMVKAAAPEAAE